MSAIPNLRANLLKRAQFRIDLECGTLAIPEEIANKFEITPELTMMWNTLWNNFLKNGKPTSTPYWFDKVANPALFNQFIKALSDEGWVTSTVIPHRHWAELELNKAKLLDYTDETTLDHIRSNVKFNRYVLENNARLTPANLTRINGKTKDTGLVRNGFARSGTMEFKYDTTYISKYYDAIVLNVNKSMIKLEEEGKIDLDEDHANFAAISKDIVDYHLYSSNDTFTLGANVNDSRGRAISSSLRKVFNPIGFKDARALLIQEPVLVPNSKTEIRRFTKSVYLFIAELLGVKRTKSEAAKAKTGREYYKARKLPKLDLTIEHDRKELHELIWLERIYTQLDAFFARNTAENFYWSIPIELDASASLLQITGTLLGYMPYITATNVMGTAINDPWYIEGLSRPKVKSAGTPILYGSSKTSKELWSKADFDFTKRESVSMDYEITDGFFQVANDFKDITIEYSQPTESMDIKIRNDEFTIECNRFKTIGEYTRRYPIYDTVSGQVLAIAHTHTKRVPDLKQFKRFFPTCLIHNLDSQIADKVTNSSTIPWIISIHDAFLVSPVHAHQARVLYALEIEDIFANRQTIINEYFKSINLSPKAMKAWNELQKSIPAFKGQFKCNLMALK